MIESNYDTWDRYGPSVEVQSLSDINKLFLVHVCQIVQVDAVVSQIFVTGYYFLLRIVCFLSSSLDEHGWFYLSEGFIYSAISSIHIS